MKDMSSIFHSESKIGLAMLTAVLSAMPLQAQADDFAEDAESAHNELIQAMTNIDPLTQQTITAPPYGADGWMPIGEDYLLRFDGSQCPNSVYDLREETSHSFASGNSYIVEKQIGNQLHQPFVVTVQQRRDNGRVLEPVMVHFVASSIQSSNGVGHPFWVNGDIYVQSMRRNPDSNALGHCSSAEWPNIYDKNYFLIHHTNDYDNIINGDYSNNARRNEVFDALATACACDLNGDGYDEILVFVSNMMYAFDGINYKFISKTNLSEYNSQLKSGYNVEEQGYGYKTTKPGNNPNTWTSVVGDIDGDGTDDVLAICNQGLYWEHQLVSLGEEYRDSNPCPDPVISVFIPGGKGTAFNDIVVKSMGPTPILNDSHRDYMPSWPLRSGGDNYKDGIVNVDTYFYYHVTLTADLFYPNGTYQSAQPVLAVAWKYQWSSKHPEDATPQDFRTNRWEWSQITTYNLLDNKKAFTALSEDKPSTSLKVDIYDLLSKAGAWNEKGGTGITKHNSDSYNKTVNARATLRRPVLKTWYAGGRNMAPLLFFEGISLYCNPAGSTKYTVANINALGNETGFSPDTPYNGRICGPSYTYLENADEDGAITDRMGIIVPVAIRELNESQSQFKDKIYAYAKGFFSAYDASDKSKTLTANESLNLELATYFNSVCHLVPYRTNTARVELLGSYFTASNPIVKALMAIPPYNVKDIVDESTAQIAFSNSKEEGSEKAQTTSTTVGGGFSMELTLFKALKLAYSYNYEQNWDESWGKSYSMTSENLYASSLANPKDMVLFNYIPVDCFEYEVTDAPGDPSLQGKRFTFRRALNMLNGEAHMPEVWWTVDDYNYWVAGTGVPRIDKKLLPHKIGNINTYRRIAAFQSKENIISNFPRKENGFYAVHEGGTAGSGDISHTLSISNGNSMSTGGGFSSSHEVSFGFQKDEVPFACEVKGSYGTSEFWEATTSWTESMSVCGTIPAIKDVRKAYNFYQVWYEYSDEESGQDFLVCDWAVGKNSLMPIYTDLQIVNLAEQEKYGNSYYKIQLDWCVNANDPVGRCVLEYKIDGVTPTRYYSGKGACMIESNPDEWMAIEKYYDPETGKWYPVNFRPEGNNSLATWDFTDYFILTYDQQKTIREKAGNKNDVYIHYRVKFYDDKDNLLTQTEESSTLLIKYNPYLFTSQEMKVDVFKLSYGTINEQFEWATVRHLNNSSHPYILYGNEVDGNNFAEISGYDRLQLHGKPFQKYYVYINGPTPVEVTMNQNGDGALDLTPFKAPVLLCGIRIAKADDPAKQEQLDKEASATLIKILKEGESIALSGDGLFPEEHNNYFLYDAYGLKRYVRFPLLNPNALIIDGEYAIAEEGKHLNIITRSTDVMQSLKSDYLRISEDYDFCFDFSVKCPHITFTREVDSPDIQYITLVLPFSIEAVKGMYEYVDFDGKNVYFNTPDDGIITAYLPIIVDMKKYGSNLINIEGEDLVGLMPDGIFNISPAPSSDFKIFYGFVEKEQEDIPIDHAELKDYDIYGFSADSYRYEKFTDFITITPFRSMFLLPKKNVAERMGMAAPENESETINVILDGKEIDNPTTGINPIITGEETGDGQTYNLLGIPVGPSYRGVVIRNGKKIIIKRP